MQREVELERLGKTIKRIRVSKGMTQPELGVAAGGLDFQAISRIERVKVNPSYFLVLSLCEALGLSLDQLWREVNRDKKVDHP